MWVGPEVCLGPTTAAREWSCAVCPTGRSWTTEKIPGEDPSWKDHAECWSGEGPGDSVGGRILKLTYRIVLPGRLKSSSAVFAIHRKPLHPVAEDRTGFYSIQVCGRDFCSYCVLVARLVRETYPGRQRFNSKRRVHSSTRFQFLILHQEKVFELPCNFPSTFFLLLPSVTLY